jgi:hypothetical protein
LSKPIDYDAPRRPPVEIDDDSLDELKARNKAAQSPTVDVDESEAAEGFELPGADLSDEELSVPVVPMRADELRCPRCFLVRHRSQMTVSSNGQSICRDCA